ncbi:MAG: complex I subunit 1 family protein [Planctomycetota bacterium]
MITIPAQTFVSLCVILIVLHMIVLSTAYLIFLERKVASWTQDRIGPNRAMFTFGQENWLSKVPVLNLLTKHRLFGLGQALADGVKLVVKEDYTPPRVDRVLFLAAPALAVIPAMIGWAVIPWGGAWNFPGLSLFGLVEVAPGLVSVAVAPLNVGVVYILAIGSLAVYGVVVGAYASNNKYSFLGGLRATAQMLSYEIPMGLCVLLMILTYGTGDLALMVGLQSAGGTGGAGIGLGPEGHTWGLIMHPVIALIFFTCVLAECNRAPFDLAEAEQELVGGFHTEYGSLKWGLFFLGEYMHMITGCAFFAAMFLGGWDISPLVGLMPGVANFGGEGWLGGLLLVLLKFGVFAGKVTLLLFVMMWIRWSLPRFRFDQLMKLAWRGMIPLMLTYLVVFAVVVYAGWGHWLVYLVLNLAVAAAAAVISPRLPQGPPVNRRVALAGSRFSPLPSEGRP